VVGHLPSMLLFTIMEKNLLTTLTCARKESNFIYIYNFNTQTLSQH
jgi:hypothetical protein